jgi:hypothetical protein
LYIKRTERKNKQEKGNCFKRFFLAIGSRLDKQILRLLFVKFLLYDLYETIFDEFNLRSLSNQNGFTYLNFLYRFFTNLENESTKNLSNYLKRYEI